MRLRLVTVILSLDDSQLGKLGCRSGLVTTVSMNTIRGVEKSGAAPVLEISQSECGKNHSICVTDNHGDTTSLPEKGRCNNPRPPGGDQKLLIIFGRKKESNLLLHLPHLHGLLHGLGSGLLGAHLPHHLGHLEVVFLCLSLRLVNGKRERWLVGGFKW